MSISTTDQAVNPSATAISQLSLSIFQLIEALLHRIQGQVDEDKDVLSFQICVLLTSLLDVHAAQQRKIKASPGSRRTRMSCFHHQK